VFNPASPKGRQERQWLRRMLLTQPGLTNQQIVLPLPICTWHSAPAGSVLARACAAAPSPASPDSPEAVRWGRLALSCLALYTPQAGRALRAGGRAGPLAGRACLLATGVRPSPLSLTNRGACALAHFFGCAICADKRADVVNPVQQGGLHTSPTCPRILGGVAGG
jgi:hypothetical protein